MIYNPQVVTDAPTSKSRLPSRSTAASTHGAMGGVFAKALGRLVGKQEMWIIMQCATAKVPLKFSIPLIFPGLRRWPMRMYSVCRCSDNELFGSLQTFHWRLGPLTPLPGQLLTAQRRIRAMIKQQESPREAEKKRPTPNHLAPAYQYLAGGKRGWDEMDAEQSAPNEQADGERTSRARTARAAVVCDFEGFG